MNKVITRWNDKYAPDELVFGSDPNVFLTTQVDQFKPNSDLLAVGDGEGRNGVWLAQLGFNVLSVDGAENGVKKAVHRAKEAGVKDRLNGLCVDLLDWQWPVEAFDTVVSLHVHFMPDERKIMYQSMINALRPGGTFLLEVFHPEQVGRDCGGPNIVELCVTPENLKEDFSELDILLVERSVRVIKTSNFHPAGEGVVSRIVARKKA